jgi:uncharacterized protein YdeI (YjbR/CyaY-like superfamily)
MPAGSSYEKPRFFPSAAHFRRWLAANHDRVRELWVGFYKKESGRPSMTYPEALDEALCHGWIDGVRKTVDATSYTSRFTPRKLDSFWSVVNTRRVAELKKTGRMEAPGLAAFSRRDRKRTKQYSYERGAARLTPAEERRFKAEARAWEFFRAQAPSYQRVATWYVASAKKDETRRRRLDALIALCAGGERLPGFARSPKRTG